MVEPSMTFKDVTRMMNAFKKCLENGNAKCEVDDSLVHLESDEYRMDMRARG